MRSKTLAANVLSIASGLVCLGVIALTITGCGGGSISPPPPPDKPTAALSANPPSISLGSSTTLTYACTNATSAAASGSWSDTLSLSGTATEKPTATGPATFTLTCTGTGGSTSASVTVTVTATTVTVTSVTLACSPASITMSQTATCVGTVHKSDESTDSLVTFTASGGTITNAGIFTPTSVGSASVVAASTEDTTKSSAPYTIAVTQDVSTLPNITSLSPPWFYADAETSQAIQINGSNFAAGQTLDFVYDGGKGGGQTIPSGQTSTQLNLTYFFDTSHYSPGWIDFSVCENSDLTNCGTMAYWAFVGNQNVLSISPTDEISVLDQAQAAQQNGILREYQPDGTPISAEPVGALDAGVATDDKTNDVAISQSTTVVNVVGKGGADAQGQTMGITAKNGYVFVTEPSVNSMGCLDITQPIGSQPFTLSLAGNQPWSLDAGVFGGGTYAFSFSRIDVSLHKTEACATTEAVPPLVLPGITPANTLQSTSPAIGGWHVVVFDEGPAAGIVAVLSAGDNVLDLVNASTMTVIGSPIKLPGVPFRIAKDVTNGKVVIAFADVKHKLTTYSSIDPIAPDPASTLTVLKATDTLLSVGFGVSTDGTKLYSAQRSALHILQNQ